MSDWSRHHLDLSFRQLGIDINVQNRSGLLSRAYSHCAKFLNSESTVSNYAVPLDALTSAILRKSIELDQDPFSTAVQMAEADIQRFTPQSTNQPELANVQINAVLYETDAFGPTGDFVTSKFNDIEAIVRKTIPGVLGYARLIGNTQFPLTYLIPKSYHSGDSASAHFILVRAGAGSRSINVSRNVNSGDFGSYVANALVDELLSPRIVKSALINHYFPGRQMDELNEVAISGFHHSPVVATFSQNDHIAAHEIYAVSMQRLGADLILDIENIGSGRALRLTDIRDKIAHQTAPVTRVDDQTRLVGNHLEGSIIYHTATGRSLERLFRASGSEEYRLSL